jgi:acetyl esterase/lipase
MKKILFLIVSFFGFAVSEAHAMTCEYKVESTLQYGTGEMSLEYDRITQKTTEQKLYLDAYIPTVCDGVTIAGNLPAIQWVHGGGFGGGRRNESGIVEIAKELAKNGFAVFSIDYRLVPNEKKKTTLPVIETLPEAERAVLLSDVQEILKKNTAESVDAAQNLYGAYVSIEDSLKAKKWIFENADRFRIAPDRMGLMGASAGAVSVLSQAYIADDVGFDRGVVTAVVDMFGTTEPLSHMETGEVPLLIIHGTEDKIIPYTESDKLLAQATKVGIPVERVIMKGAGHGLREADILHRKGEGASQPIMSQVVAFLDQYLRCHPDTGCVPPTVGSDEASQRVGFWHRLWNSILRFFRD